MKVPNGTQAESRVKRFARWARNDRITEEVYFVPYAQVLLAHLALHTLVLIMDGSVVGRGCVALMMHVVYKGRALPVAWQVRKGKKGHFPEDLHIALVKQVQPLIPPGASVVLLGDGEFDGTLLQQTLQDVHWTYVVRTGSNITVLRRSNPRGRRPDDGAVPDSPPANSQPREATRRHGVPGGPSGEQRQRDAGG
jgi:hypothetical protein